MKKAATLAVTVAAASPVAFVYGHDSNEKGSGGKGEGAAGSGSRRGGGNDKFAPRFDGLRFIETLVTAHR